MSGQRGRYGASVRASCCLSVPLCVNCGWFTCVLAQAAVTKYQPGWLINNRRLFPAVLEAEIRMPTPSGSGEDPLQGSNCPMCPHTAESTGKKQALSSSSKGTGPSQEGSTFMT